MRLYFSPLACSLATRAALYEAGAQAQYTQVDPKTKLTDGGDDFFAVSPMGQVPVLVTEEGQALSENAAVLQYVADRFPASGLAPMEGWDRSELQRWLGFIGTELHKAVFVPQLDAQAPDDAKAYARAKAALRMNVLQQHLSSRCHLLDDFSVADVYLATVLNWTVPTGFDLGEWPVVQAYHQRMHQRPHYARAFAEELALYRQEQAKAKQAQAAAQPAAR